MKILSFCIIALCSVAIGIILGKSAKKKFRLGFYWPYPVIFTVLSCLYYIRFGLAKEYFVGVSMLIVCLLFSVSDILTRHVSDAMHIIFAIVGCANLSGKSVVSMVLGALFLGLIMLGAALAQKGTMGGADIKFSAAIGWFFGLEKGLLVLITGLLLSVLTTVFISIKKGKKQTSIPMIPYLSVACAAVYFTM